VGKDSTTKEIFFIDRTGKKSSGRESMYVALLFNALENWDKDLSDDELVEYVLTRRTEMLSALPRRGESTYSALASEIAYDRALIKLCEAHDLEVVAANFAHPREERDHLEHELGAAGYDLNALARKRRS
jgi:hypothetical protein